MNILYKLNVLVVTTQAPNIAREIVMDLKLPSKITGVTVSRACLSGLQAILQAVDYIEQGHGDVVIAGGSDSMSNGIRLFHKQNTNHSK